MSHVKRKTIIHTSDEDQIDSNIIFDDSFVENNHATFEHDSNAHEEYNNIRMLAYNAQSKAENQKRLNNELKKQKELLQKNLQTCNDQKWVAKLSTLPSAFVSCDTVHFGNDHFTAITGYGDYVQGNLRICHVYYVEGLRYNLFSVGQCDGDLEVPFHSNTCYVRNLENDDLLTGSHDLNLYTIFISEMEASSLPVNKAKAKKASLTPKLVPSTESKLKLLHMNFYGPMRVASINGKKYILVIVDDYSRYTWVYFLRTKDEAPDMIIDFVNQVQGNLKAQILTIHTDNGIEFKNEKLWAFYAKLDSSKDSVSVPSKSDLDNLFGPLYEEYYATSSQEVSYNSATNTLDNEHTPSSLSIIVEEDEAPQIVCSSAEQVATEPNSPVLNENTDEFIQKDVADFYGNVLYNEPPTPVFEKAESSSTYQDPLNMHEFHQRHC
uniref:Integrase, catalytic region, zinc finger, CCHC-type, peptidase aspartic, catalytic n=1 Tax=Tanacetum cinerariifolium TaxID=118510 RepID=A0A6L2JGU9_TANCI|nr:integrase, catalytic region, zinc finger, CCHC-type, peptidase aspartic, catalytic [Tanacetum cinerariifolium]